MVASLLENFDNVLQCCGMNDVLVQAMYEDVKIHKISLSEPKRWGKLRTESEILNGNRENIFLPPFSFENKLAQNDYALVKRCV